MSDQFAGLCIGGPMAGQKAVSQSQSLRVDVRPPLKVQLQESIAEPDAVRDITVFTYKWHHTGGFGLWIAEGETLLDAVKQMALAYEAAHKTEPRPRRPQR